MAEQGLPAARSAPTGSASRAQAGTPEPIVAKLHAEIVRRLNAPSVKERLANIGVEPGGDTPDATHGFRAEEIGVAKVVKDTGTTIN